MAEEQQPRPAQQPPQSPQPYPPQQWYGYPPQYPPYPYQQPYPPYQQAYPYYPEGYPQQPAPQQPAWQPPAGQPPVASPQPASAPSAPAAPVRQRVHHSFIWLNCLRAVIALVVVCAFTVLQAAVEGVFTGNSESVTEGLLAVAIVLALCGIVFLVLIGYYAVAWHYLSYELGPEEFTVYSGILVKKRNHVPYRRIQSVEQNASLLQRLFGVCTVTIDTAGGAANNAVMVPYISKTQAEELRRELFARKQLADDPQAAAQYAPSPSISGGRPAVPQQPGAGAMSNVLDAPAEIWEDVRGVFGGDAVDTGRVTYEYGLTNGELVLTGISGSGNGLGYAALVVSVLSVVLEVCSVAVVALSNEVLSNTTSTVLSGKMLAVEVIVIAIVVLVVVGVVSAIGTCVSYGGFRARRRAGRIEVEYGLLQHRIQGVDVDRVQYLRVKQGFVRRLMGYCELSVGKVNAVSGGGDDGSAYADTTDLVIHPFVKVDRVPEIVAGIIPEYSGMPLVDRHVAPVALRRAIVRRAVLKGVGFWMAVVLAAAQAFMNAFAAEMVDDVILSVLNSAFVVGYVICAVVALFEVTGAVLWFRGSAYAYNDRFVQVSNAGFSVETVGMPRTKLQFAWTRTNPLQRRAGTATICLRSAAGVAGTTVELVDLRREEAEAFLKWVEPKAAG